MSTFVGSSRGKVTSHRERPPALSDICLANSTSSRNIEPDSPARAAARAAARVTSASAVWTVSTMLFDGASPTKRERVARPEGERQLCLPTSLACSLPDKKLVYLEVNEDKKEVANAEDKKNGKRDPEQAVEQQAEGELEKNFISTNHEESLTMIDPGDSLAKSRDRITERERAGSAEEREGEDDGEESGEGDGKDREVGGRREHRGRLGTAARSLPLIDKENMEPPSPTRIAQPQGSPDCVRHSFSHASGSEYSYVLEGCSYFFIGDHQPDVFRRLTQAQTRGARHKRPASASQTSTGGGCGTSSPTASPSRSRRGTLNVISPRSSPLPPAPVVATRPSFFAGRICSTDELTEQIVEAKRREVQQLMARNARRVARQVVAREAAGFANQEQVGKRLH